MPSRRPHSKSRNGCAQCKQRHIKCSLTGPICLSCDHRNLPCSFLEVLSDEGPSRSPRCFATPSAAATVSSDAGMATAHPPMELVLLNPPNFTTFKLSPSYPPPPSFLLSYGRPNAFSDAGWIPTVTREINKHAFLQQNFQALTTLYIEERNSKMLSCRKYIEVCKSHLKAIKLFQGTMMTSSSEDWAAIVLFSMTILLYQLRMASLRPAETSMADVLNALKHAGQVVKSTAPAFVEAREREARITRSIQQDSSDMSTTDLLQYLRYLEQVKILMKEEMEGSYKNTADHLHAIEQLEQWILRTQGSPHTWMHLVSWPAAISHGFIELVMNELWASAITLPWLLLIQNTPTSWPTRGWPASFAQQASEQLLGRLDAKLLATVCVDVSGK